jgi:hypothetical protein
LRGTVHLVTAEGEEIFAGTGCAARRVGTTAHRIRKAVEWQQIRAEAERAHLRQEARFVLRALGHLPAGTRPRELFTAWRAACESTGRHLSTCPGPGKLSEAVPWALSILG